MPLLMICEPVGLFLKILTVNDKCSLCNGENLHQPIQMELSQKQKIFFNFLLHFWNLHQILNILTKRMIVIAYVLCKLWTVKNVVRKKSKEFRLRRPFDSQHAKVSETILKSARQHFSHVFFITLRKIA